MITLEELKEFLEQYNLPNIPDFILQCIVDEVNGVYDCLIENGATECQAKLVLMYAATLIVLGQGGSMISSQSVDVLSQSFKYQDIVYIQNGLRNNLYLYDKWGCTNAIVPVDPNGRTVFEVVDGSSC